MNTLYLHIGMHKTATTTIQHFLADNDEVLKTKGYTYPKFPFHYPYKGADRNGLFIWSPYFDYEHVRHPEIEEQYYREGMEIVHDIFKTYHNVIISNERLWYDFSKYDHAKLKLLLQDAKENDYQVKLILYVRRQDKFVESYWNEVVKSNVIETRKLDQYIQDFPSLKYGQFFSGIGDLVGDENLLMRRFEEAVKGDGIIADFMRSIGLELTDEYTVREGRSNTQLYGNVTEIKRLINEMDGLKKGDADFLRDAMRMASDTSKKNYPCSELTEEEHAKLMEQFKEEKTPSETPLLREKKRQRIFSGKYKDAFFTLISPRLPRLLL